MADDPTGTVRIRTNLTGTCQIVPTVPLFRTTGHRLDKQLTYDVDLSGADVAIDIPPTDGTDFEPRPFQWRARWFTDGPDIPDTIFDLPGGGEVELADYISLDLTPSIIVVASAADRIAAEQAAARAESAADRAEAIGGIGPHVVSLAGLTGEITLEELRTLLGLDTVTPPDPGADIVLTPAGPGRYAVSGTGLTVVTPGRYALTSPNLVALGDGRYTFPQ